MENPFHEVHLREIARLSEVSRGNVDIFLRQFVKEGMLKRRKVSNMTFFRPDLSSEPLLKIFEYLEIGKRELFFERNKKIARLLRQYTEDLLVLSGRKIQMIVLFGSVARGDWTKKSDLDILAVVADKSEELPNIFIKAQRAVSPALEIRPISTTIDKFKTGFKNKAEFYGELWRDRIVLYNEFLFWQLIKEAGEAGA
ncbi:MAG: nucleotidyltransferase domain-containing protein [Candidatus Gracilibacteria bacterium]